MANKPVKIRKAVIPAAAPVLHLLAPEVYVLASQEREYRVALDDLFGIVSYI